MLYMKCKSWIVEKTKFCAPGDEMNYLRRDHEDYKLRDLALGNLGKLI